MSKLCFGNGEFCFKYGELLHLLWGLIPLLLLFLWFMNWRKNAVGKMGESSLVGRLMPQKPTFKHQLKFVLLAISYTCIVLALARPQWSQKSEPVTRSGVDLIVALDISNSMRAEDVQPSRIAKSKQFISRLVDKLSGDRIGLMVFAGNTYQMVPLTADYVATKTLLGSISTDLAPTQGTAIGDAIEMADSAFVKGEKQHKTLLIISDGENHEGKALEAAESAAERGVVIHTMGIGTTKGAPIPEYRGGRETDYKRDRGGNIVFSKLNEQMLQQVASAGNGSYYRLTGSNDQVKDILGELAKMEKKDFEERIFTDYEDQYQWFLAFALFFLALEYFLSERRSVVFSDWAIFKTEK